MSCVCPSDSEDPNGILHNPRCLVALIGDMTNKITKSTAKMLKRTHVIQKTMPDLGCDLLRVLEKGTCSDFTLVLKDGEQLKVHRVILAARSLVFQKMLEVDMKERITGNVEIKAYDPEVVKEFVKYLYSDYVIDDSSNLVELFKISHQYEAYCLVEKCSKKLVHSLSLDNVVQLGKLAEEYEIAELSNECAVFIAENFKKIETEKLDSLPATLLRKSLATHVTKMTENEPSQNVTKTKYVAKFYTNLSYSVKTKDFSFEKISTDFKVSRDTNLAGFGLFITSGTTEAIEQLPVEVSVTLKGENLTNLKFSASVASGSESKLLKIIFPSAVKIIHDTGFIWHELSIKVGKDCVVFRTDGTKRTLTVPMKSGELDVKTSGYQICQIPVFYFEE